MIDEPTPIDWESHAKAFGWYQTSPAPPLTVAAKPLVHVFVGYDAWEKAVKYSLEHGLYDL